LKGVNALPAIKPRFLNLSLLRWRLTHFEAINMFLRYSVRYGGILFELRVEKPNAETLAAIDDVNNNRNMSKTFTSVDDLKEDLNA